MNCEAASAVFALAPCPRAGALGGCRETLAIGTITDWYYEDGVLTANDVRMMCEEDARVGFPIDFVAP